MTESNQYSMKHVWRVILISFLVGFIGAGYFFYEPTIYGCTDPNAFNYDVNANTEDGSCEEIVLGCIDSDMWNFDEIANTDAGSCITHEQHQKELEEEEARKKEEEAEKQRKIQAENELKAQELIELYSGKYHEQYTTAGGAIMDFTMGVGAFTVKGNEISAFTIIDIEAYLGFTILKDRYTYQLIYNKYNDSFCLEDSEGNGYFKYGNPCSGFKLQADGYYNLITDDFSTRKISTL
jgi:hypothetical protein